MIVGGLAPAKINLGLEILGRRDDGYHEIRTILAAVSRFDRIEVRKNDRVRIECDDSGIDADRNLVTLAARQFQQNSLDVSPAITVRKRIPSAAGLGGGSSDAAAAILAIDRCYRLQTPIDHLIRIATSIGSDVPFFFTGGIALASGRGEIITPLPFAGQLFVVLVAPRIEIPAKTATLYAALRPADFSDGSRIANMSGVPPHDLTVQDQLLANAFERPLYERLPALRELPALLRSHGARAVGLSGAGPAHYALETDPERARRLGSSLAMSLKHMALVLVCAVVPHGVVISNPTIPSRIDEWFADIDHN